MSPNLFGDWVSGLFRLPARNLADEIAANAELQAQVDRLHQDKMELARQLDAVSRERDGLKKRLNHARGYLRAIAARPTPSAKSDARDMARMAREALE